MKMAAKSKWKNRWPLRASLLLLSSLSLTACNFNERYFSFISFDTYLSFSYNCRTDLEMTFKNVSNNLSNLVDAYYHKEGITNLFDLNNSTEAISIDDDLYDLLKLGLYYEEQTEGMFSLFVKDLCDAYKESYNHYYFDYEVSFDVDEYLNKIRNTTLEFTDNKAYVNGEATLDVGAIAKGYLLEKKIKPILKQENITQYLMNAGNSSIILGENSKRKGFYNVGINYSDYYMKLKNCAIGTSSVYEQNYAVNPDGSTSGHIVNPKTGSSVAENELCVCIADDACLADVLSTVGVITPLEGIKELETKFNVRFITFKNYSLTYCNPEITLYESK